MSTVILYGTPGSPSTRIAQLGLEEKHVPHELIEVVFGDHLKPPHLDRHPFGRVPVIDHDGFRLYEAQAILRYLNAVHPEPSLCPREARAAARMDQMIGIVDWYFHPQVSTTITWQRLVVPRWGQQPDESVIARALPHAEVCVHEIARLLGSNPYVAGAQLSIADPMLAPHLSCFAMTTEGSDLVRAYPHLRDWLARMEARPSMKNTDPFATAPAA